MKFQPRYIAYARAHRRAPARQLAYDKRQGSSMHKYTIWIGKQRRAFKETHSSAFVGDCIIDHNAFTIFCQQRDSISRKAVSG